MTASSRGSRRAAGLLIRSTNPHHPRVCSDCIFLLSSATAQSSSLPRRAYSAAATAPSPSPSTPPPPSTQPTPSPIDHSSTSPYALQTGLIVSRPPLLTPNQHPFEKAFFFYQKRLNERLAMPFTRYFYFKKDTPADLEWKARAKERNGVAGRDVAGYQAWGKEGWNDELLVGEGGVQEGEWVRDLLVKESIGRGGEVMEGVEGVGEGKGVVEGQEEAEAEGDAEGEKVELGMGAVEGKEDVIEKLNDRITQADKEKDVRRLDRKLTRTLYLVVKRADGAWGFPAGGLVGRENLNQAAERILIQSLGPNLNTWIVGHAPIAHHILEPRYAEGTAEEKSEGKQLVRPGHKTFYMKARVMAGQVDLKGNQFGLSDWKWLTKQEVQRLVAPGLWRGVGGCLGDR